MKKFVLCMSVFCSLEAYAIDREEISDFFKAGTTLMQNCNYLKQRDIESQCKDAANEEMLIFVIPASNRITVKHPDGIEYESEEIIFGKKKRKTYYEFLSEYLADFYQKLLERDPKAISQATGVIVVICGVMKFFLQKFI